MAKRTVRVGVGTSEFPKSALWSIVVDGSEVYVSQRSSFGLAKFSLHSSGKWRFAVNSERWAKLEDRALLKWDRPSPIFDSWVLGPTIVFPPLFAKTPLSFSDQYNKKIKWLTPPTKEQERILILFFSKGELSVDKYLEKTKLNPDWVTRLDIKDSGRMNADTVWIISWVDKLREFTKNQVLDILRGMKIHYKKDSDLTNFSGVANPVYLGTEEERARGLSPTVITVILGKNNLEEDEI